MESIKRQPRRDLIEFNTTKDKRLRTKAYYFYRKKGYFKRNYLIKEIIEKTNYQLEVIEELPQG